MSYKSLENTKAFEDIIKIITGSYLGVSFLAGKISVAIELIVILIVIILIGVKMYSKETRKWDFNHKIIEHLKRDEEQNETMSEKVSFKTKVKVQKQCHSRNIKKVRCY